MFQVIKLAEILSSILNNRGLVDFTIYYCDRYDLQFCKCNNLLFSCKKYFQASNLRYLFADLSLKCLMYAR